MQVQYESTLDDISEPQIRYYLRSKGYRKQRVKEAIWGGIGAIGGYFIITSILGDFNRPVWSYPALFLIGNILVLLTLKDTVSKRITKHLKNSIGDKLPIETSYLVSNGKLISSNINIDITFDLADVRSITEDDERLEISFGDLGLCTIPLRAFTDGTTKENFLKLIRREQDAAPN